MPQPKTESWLHAGSGPPTVVVGGKGCAPGGIITPVAGTGWNRRKIASEMAPMPHRMATNFTQPPTSGMVVRSEEHTSELQSRLHLVCRLLLEKKTKIPRLVDT